MDKSDIDSLDEANPVAEIGDYAMEFITRCEGCWDTFRLGEIVIVAEIVYTDADGEEHIDVASLSSEDRIYVQKAILLKAIENARLCEIAELEDED